MRKSLKGSAELEGINGKYGLRLFFEKLTKKIKKGQFTCPLCRDVLHGISAFGAHLKKHCT